VTPQMADMARKESVPGCNTRPLSRPKSVDAAVKSACEKRSEDNRSRLRRTILSWRSGAESKRCSRALDRWRDARKN